MKFAHLFILLFLIGNVSAVCDENQIDINSATKEKLQTFTGIGPVKSQAIIDYRETKKFNSVDELINVYGIGEVTLNNIKMERGCVSEETDKSESDNETKIYSKNKTLEKVFLEDNSEIESVKREDIDLTPKAIKSSDDGEYNLYAILGLASFSVLLVFLFALKKLRRNKNEFD